MPCRNDRKFSEGLGSWRNHLKVNGKNIQSYEEIIDNLSEKIQALNKVANILYDTWVSKIYDH